jgi:hypothetical protein
MDRVDLTSLYSHIESSSEQTLADGRKGGTFMTTHEEVRTTRGASWTATD